MSSKLFPIQACSKRKTYALAGVIACIFICAGVFYYVQHQNAAKDPQQAATQELADVIQKVQKHMYLPEKETPTLATVVDKEKLKSQPFFTSVANEDKILIYTQSKKAIVYRPSIDKIINAGPIVTSETETTETQAK